jgi:hypothetical protein
MENARHRSSRTLTAVPSVRHQPRIRDRTVDLQLDELGGERPKPGDIPDEETGQFGDDDDPGLESDEDLDGEQDADGGEPLHR